MAKRTWVRTAACPQCGQVGEVRPIVYGMPDSSFDFANWEVGGCCISSDMPEASCRACDWSGKFAQVRAGRA